ncbi:MAG: ParB/RepB/Spo0J family partition protein [Propionibacteriaceae bacterium]|jgi:ParB family chromosome partitioning protein|nr:ParB/RepB/Spo0J family partition protein [Propionibacteriaceae bacterium]
MAAAKHVGLGRGLGELLQRTDPEAYFDALTDHDAPAGARFVEVSVDKITPNPKQPRAVFDEDALAELAESIAEVGLLQPVVVRPVEGGDYELVMGERRLRAAKLAGLKTIPAVVRRTEEADLLRDALLENIHRAQLNPLEEAAAYQQLLSDFGCTQEELSGKIKRSRAQIANTIRLLQLPPAVQRRVAAGVLSAGHARALLSLTSGEEMEKMANRVVAEGLSVRNVEELVALAEPEHKRTTKKVAAKARAALAQAVEDELSDALDTRVTVTGTAKRGKIVIDYAGEDDLARLRGLLQGVKPNGD